MKVRHSATLYYVIQGLAVIGWWAVLYLVPSTRQYFALESPSETSLMAFWLADLSFLGIGSLAVSWLCYRDHEYSRIAAWFVTGAVSYAAVYCFAFSLMTDVGWLGVTLMFPAMIWSGVFAVGLSFDKTMFREAAEASTNWILLKTLTQIVVVWSVILVVFPYLITIVEDKLSIMRLQFPFQRPLATFLFVSISSLGVWGSTVMSRIGKGTPLPLDHAKHLVIRGPYAFVRNPMAVSGVGARAGRCIISRLASGRSIRVDGIVGVATHLSASRRRRPARAFRFAVRRIQAECEVLDTTIPGIF